MTSAQANQEYFDWMLRKVCESKEQADSYHLLLNTLYEKDFVWSFSQPMDENRQVDGEELRYTFGREMDYPDPMIASLLDVRPCSMLEMMVALAIKCEERFAFDPDVGNRTSVWFWEMIDSLGLSKMTDDQFDFSYTDRCITNFLNHSYKPNGEGSLFTVKRPVKDMRNVDIWYQMCYYLNEVL